MPQPYPDPTNINQTVDIMRYANTVTNNWFVTLVPASLAVMVTGIMIVKGTYKISQCFLGGFTASFVLGSMLWAAGLIAGKIIVLYLLLMVASAVWTFFD